MNILFLSNRPTKNSQAATVTEYLDALGQFSKHRVFEVSMLGRFPKKLDLSRFDVVLTHYSLSLGPLIQHYLGDDLIAQFRNFKGLKAAFLQDEYREIKTYWKNLNDIGIDVLFSCVPDEEIRKVYPRSEVPNLSVQNVLTGYVPHSLTKQDVLPVKDRPIDVGYRTRKMPYWLGALGREKVFIAEEFERLGTAKGLRLDLSTKEGERLYGDAWTNFVASCRAVIGVESGASIIDFDGKLERKVDAYCAKHPNASFEEVSDLFLKPFEGSLRLHQISPRCFEAAALRTPMILFEGTYSGVLQPDQHFIPLKKDFSNFDAVVEKLRDPKGLQAMADRTYRDVALNPEYSYQNFVKILDAVLESERDARQAARTLNPYNQKSFRQAVRTSWRYSIGRYAAMRLQSLLLGLPVARKALFGLWYILPQPLQRIARPMARIISR